MTMNSSACQWRRASIKVDTYVTIESSASKGKEINLPANNLTVSCRFQILQNSNSRKALKFFESLKINLSSPNLSLLWKSLSQSIAKQTSFWIHKVIILFNQTFCSNDSAFNLFLVHPTNLLESFPLTIKLYKFRVKIFLFLLFLSVIS